MACCEIAWSRNGKFEDGQPDCWASTKSLRNVRVAKMELVGSLGFTHDCSHELSNVDYGQVVNWTYFFHFKFYVAPLLRLRSFRPKGRE